MRDISIQLSGINGEPLGKLRTTAWQLIEKAEQEARNRNLSKTSALKAILSEVLEESNFSVSDKNLSDECSDHAQGANSTKEGGR